MYFAFLLALSLLCSLLTSAIPAGAAVEFFVSKGGSDAWSGRLAAPNKTETDGPFATLERARDAVRAIKDPNAQAVVQIRSGTYFLKETLVFGPKDTHPVMFTAYKNEKVTISGGRPITGFKPVEVNGKKMVAAQVPDVRDGKWYPTQLFVNDRRRPRTRLPRTGYYRIADVPGVPCKSPWGKTIDTFAFEPGQFRADWRNLNDVDMVAVNYWQEQRMQVKSVNETLHHVVMNKPSRGRLWADRIKNVGSRYWIENVFEALDTPGQWYLDRPTGTLYYYPYVGEETTRISAVAPRLEQLVVVGTGLDSNTHLSGIRFENLRFAHTEPVWPADRAGYDQAAVGVHGAVQFVRARDCSVTNCEISRIGTCGVEVGGTTTLCAPSQTTQNKEEKQPVAETPQCQAIKIERNRIMDMGAGGVKADHKTEGTIVTDNEIFDGGKLFMSAVGVLVRNCPNNVVSHNHIHDMDYSGVSVGWVWGYRNTNAYDNKIEFNHIHDVGRYVLSDLAGIYTLGTQNGTVIRNNLIHDCYAASYGGWGLYNDEGSSNILLENNVVYNTGNGGYHLHYGKDNIIRNNVFAFAKEHQIQRSREEEHNSFTFEHNIVYYDEGNLLSKNWTNDKFVIDYNDYWDASGRTVTFAETPLEEWRKRGHDEHSIIADPLFVDAEGFDFRLRPESPALELGFKQIDLSTVGPRYKAGPVQ